MRRKVKVGLQSVAGVASAVTPHTHTLCFDSVTAECHEPGMAPAAVPPHPHTLFVAFSRVARTALLPVGQCLCCP